MFYPSNLNHILPVPIIFRLIFFREVVYLLLLPGLLLVSCKDFPSFFITPVFSRTRVHSLHAQTVFFCCLHRMNNFFSTASLPAFLWMNQFFKYFLCSQFNDGCLFFYITVFFLVHIFYLWFISELCRWHFAHFFLDLTIICFWWSIQNSQSPTLCILQEAYCPVPRKFPIYFPFPHKQSFRELIAWCPSFCKGGTLFIISTLIGLWKF